MSDWATTRPVFWGETDDTEALQRYRTLVNTIDDGIYQLNDEDCFVAVNDVLIEITGYAPEELLGEHVSVLFDEEDVSTIEREIERLSVNPAERSELLDVTVQTTEARQVRCELQVNLLGAGSPALGTVGIVRDITERKRRGRERKRVVRALEAAREGISLLDEDGEFIYVNDAYADTFGYDPGEMIGRHWDALGIEANPEQFHDEVLPDIEDEGQWTGTTTCVQSDDSTFLAQHSLTPTEDGELICVVRDVTKQAKREQDLRKTKEQLEIATEAASVGIWTWDIQKDVVTADTYLAESYGMDPEKVAAGAPMEAFYEPIHEADEEETWEQLERAVEETGELEAEYRIRDDEGELLWIEARGEVQYDDGEPIRMHGAVSDITDRKRRERRTRFLENLSRELQPLSDPDEIMAAAARLLGEHLGVDRCAYAQVESDEDKFRITGDYTRGDTASIEGRWAMSAFGEEALRLMRQDSVYVVDDIDADERITAPDREAYEQTGVQSIIWVPLHKDGQLVSGMAVHQQTPREWQSHEVDLVTTVVQRCWESLQRARAMRDLQESEERLRLALDCAEMGVWELDLQTGDSPVHSPQHDRIFGYEEPLENWGVETFLDHVHPDDCEWVEQGFEDALETGKWEFECRIIRADGEQRWIAAQGEFYYDEGEPVRAVGTVQDITEQKEQERQLRDAKSRLEAATEAGAVGTWEWHIPEDRIVAGPSFARKFGLDPDAAAEGVPLEQFVSAIHEADRERVEQEIKEAVESCGEYEAEYRVRNADDELRWVVARGHVECDEDGNPIMFPGALTDITQRKESQRKIRESERRYRTLVENFPNGAVGLFDEDLRYTAVGGQFLNEANISKEERIGHSVYDIYPDELIDEIEPNFHAALRGEMNSFEVTYHGRHLHAHTLPVRDDDDEVFAGMLVVQDVTERREAQRGLRESEAKFRMLAENLREIVWMATPDAEEFIYINPAFEEVWGLDRDELYNEPVSFLEAVHPDDRERVREGFAALPDSEFDDEFRIIRLDGEVRWVHAQGARVNDEDGEMARIVGIGEDVTERKERERELEQSERRYRTLAENFPSGAVAVYDDDLRYTLAQGSVLGDTLPIRNQVEGRIVSEVFPQYIVEDLDPLLRAAVEDGETGDAKFEFGGRYWRVWASPLRDDGGDIFAGLSFAQDVTEQVEREQRLEELIDDLETSNERLEQFAYAASHDLQEPLRMVSSYLQLIEQRYADALDENGEEFLEFAVDGADRMRNMIDGLLKYSRVETRGDSFEPVDLDTVFEEVRDDLQVKIGESDAEITTESLPCVEGDEGQLRQVFQNLLDNAIEYSGDKPPQIRVSAERDLDGWTISIRDEGIGIEAYDTDRVFEVFESLHTPDDHSGIGLALCERIIERHDGDIWVDSEPGKGATFSFTLPAKGEHSE